LQKRRRAAPEGVHLRLHLNANGRGGPWPPLSGALWAAHVARARSGGFDFLAFDVKEEDVERLRMEYQEVRALFDRSAYWWNKYPAGNLPEAGSGIGGLGRPLVMSPTPRTCHSIAISPVSCILV
jgi:hypothetical protein